MRAAAAKALGTFRIRDRDVVDALVKLLKDDFSDARAAAAGALIAIYRPEIESMQDKGVEHFMAALRSGEIRPT